MLIMHCRLSRNETPPPKRHIGTEEMEVSSVAILEERNIYGRPWIHGSFLCKHATSCECFHMNPIFPPVDIQQIQFPC